MRRLQIHCWSRYRIVAKLSAEKGFAAGAGIHQLSIASNQLSDDDGSEKTIAFNTSHDLMPLPGRI